jgi:hypothetical protein
LSGIDSKAAIQAAIEEHLKQQPNVFFQNMTVEVGDVTFNGVTAQAEVKFRSKQAPNLAVGMLYKLRRVGKGWQVESASSASMPGTSPRGNAVAPTPSPSTTPGEIAPQPSH